MTLPSIVGSFAVIRTAPQIEAYHATCTDELLALLVHKDGLNLPPKILVDIQDAANWTHTPDCPFYHFEFTQGFNKVTVTQLFQVPTLHDNRN